MPAGQARRLEAFLGEVTSGQLPKKFVQRINDEAKLIQETAFRRHKHLQTRVRDEIKRGGRPADQPGLLDYLKIDVVREAYEKDIETVCRRLRRTDGLRVARNVLSFMGKFPYFETMLKLDATLDHWELVNDRRVDEGGPMDMAHLTYVQGVDVFVTNEKSIHTIFPRVFGPTKRVLNFEDFMGEVLKP